MKPFFFFVLGAVFFAACGSAQIRFSYPFYHFSPSSVWQVPSGKLLGPSEGKDRLATECSPVKDANGKTVQRCVVVFYSDLNRLIADYKNTKQELIDCQRGRK